MREVALGCAVQRHEQPQLELRSSRADTGCSRRRARAAALRVPVQRDVGTGPAAVDAAHRRAGLDDPRAHLGGVRRMTTWLVTGIDSPEWVGLVLAGLGRSHRLNTGDRMCSTCRGGIGTPITPTSPEAGHLDGFALQTLQTMNLMWDRL